jgi:hypothetical protein
MTKSLWGVWGVAVLLSGTLLTGCSKEGGGDKAAGGTYLNLNEVNKNAPKEMSSDAMRGTYSKPGGPTGRGGPGGGPPGMMRGYPGGGPPGGSR